MYNIESGVTLAFDGPNKRITLDFVVTGATVKIVDIFNYWVTWVMESGSSYLQAFDRIGGDAINANQNISYYYSLMNNWKIITTTSLLDYVELILDGNLITSDNTNPFSFSESTGRIYIRSVISANIITTTGSGGTVNCSGVTEQLNVIQSGITLIQSEISTTNSGITSILSGITSIEDEIAAHRVATEDRIKYILGLVQSNFRIYDQMYNSDNLLTHSQIRIYNSNADALLNINPLKEYDMNASYDSQGRLIQYVVVEHA